MIQIANNSNNQIIIVSWYRKSMKMNQKIANYSEEWSQTILQLY